MTNFEHLKPDRFGGSARAARPELAPHFKAPVLVSPNTDPDQGATSCVF